MAELIRTKLDALKKLAGNLGVDPAETARCVTNNDALNLIAQHLGGETGARTNAEAIKNIAEVASAGGGEQNVEWADGAVSFGLIPPGGPSLFKSVTVPEGVESTISGAFAGFVNLETVRFPSTLATVAQGTFDGCRSLKSVDLGGAVSLGPAIFSNSTLQSLTIPGTVTTIDKDAFVSSSLTEINIHKPEGSIEGAPWGATNATVNWLG